MTATATFRVDGHAPAHGHGHDNDYAHDHELTPESPQDSTNLIRAKD
jgi:hypothetical protein